MIRRSPTRIELKLDDIQEFDYVQKYDKKKNPPADNGTNLSAASAAKLLRHERIGYHRSGSGSGTGATAVRSGSGFCNPTTAGSVASTDGATTSSQQSSTSTITGATSTSTPVPVNPELAGSDPVPPPPSMDPANLPSEIEAAETNDMDLIDFNSTYASAQMSMDET